MINDEYGDFLTIEEVGNVLDISSQRVMGLVRTGRLIPFDKGENGEYIFEKSYLSLIDDFSRIFNTDWDDFISITPKKLLHDILATHTDAKPGTFLSNTHTAQIHKSGINCQLDQLIVESPFLEIEVHALVLMPIPKNDFYQTRVCFSFFLPILV